MKNLYKPFFITLIAMAAALCLSVFAFAAETEAAAVDAESSASIVHEEETVPASDTFTDLDYSSKPEALRYMIDEGYIFGFTDGSFRPGRSYTRLELAQLVAQLCELETAEKYKNSFYDTEIAGADAIDATVSNDLMTGRSANSFEPYDNVLKAELIGTLEKCAAYLELEGFYDHASGDYTDWETDYTICTADEAMQCAYQLAQALELKAEAAAEAAEAEAAAQAVAELNGESLASDEMNADASGEIIKDDTASGEPAVADDDDNTEVSGEIADDASSEPSASAEPAEAAADTAQSSTPPEGVITADTQAAQPAEVQAAAPAAPAAAAAEVVTESDSEADAIRNAIKDKYNEIYAEIVSFLQGLLA